MEQLGPADPADCKQAEFVMVAPNRVEARSAERPARVTLCLLLACGRARGGIRVFRCGGVEMALLVFRSIGTDACLPWARGRRILSAVAGRLDPGLCGRGRFLFRGGLISVSVLGHVAISSGDPQSYWTPASQL